MSFRGKAGVPATPRVISPSPTPSEVAAGAGAENGDYFGPVTRSTTRKRQSLAHRPLPEHEDEDEDAYDAGGGALRRARTRSRSPIDTRRVAPLTTIKSGRKAGGLEVVTNGKVATPAAGSASTSSTTTTNGHLAVPGSAASPGWSWRDFSRSPSPLGLIPIHRHWRTFVHKHEVPRKVLHVSIGFLTLWLYLAGRQTSAVTPWLMAALLPITTVDVVRHRSASFNRFYVRVLGALMRESEFAGYNGVIFYLLGAWIVLHFFPEDVSLVSVLLLSWCDTAASTFGRLYGRYTPRIRRGKSLAGSFAAFVVGVATSAFFWGWLAPRTGPFPGDEAFPFMFTGQLRLPGAVADVVGLSPAQATVAGPVALGVLSVWAGLVAAASEVADLFGWDDNLTIPVLSGIGIWGFLKIFG